MPDQARSFPSRRRLLTASMLGVAGAGTLSTGAAAASAPRDGSDLADAVCAAFRNHRLVAIGEAGTHGLQEHNDALTRLLTDPRLPGVVDDVIVEFGNARYQPVVDRFVAGGAVENAELRKVWRDTSQSPLSTWDAPVFEQHFRTVRAVNQGRPRDRQLRVLLGDPPIDWPAVTTRAELSAVLVQRDAHAATVVEREVLRKGRRALLCYGADHVLHGSRIERQLRVRPYVIATLVPLAGDPGGLAERLSTYPAPSVIRTAGSWLGRFDAGLLLPAAIRGGDGDPVNLRCGVPLGTLLDAGLHVGRPEQLTVSRENPAIYLDEEYWTELRRRNALWGGIVDLDRYRREQSTRFEPETLPPGMECP
jgi:hypothetical protein